MRWSVYFLVELCFGLVAGFAPGARPGGGGFNWETGFDEEPYPPLFSMAVGPPVVRFATNFLRRR